MGVVNELLEATSRFYRNVKLNGFKKQMKYLLVYCTEQKNLLDIFYFSWQNVIERIHFYLNEENLINCC